MFELVLSEFRGLHFEIQALEIYLESHEQLFGGKQQRLLDIKREALLFCKKFYDKYEQRLQSSALKDDAVKLERISQKLLNFNNIFVFRAELGEWRNFAAPEQANELSRIFKPLIKFLRNDKKYPASTEEAFSERKQRLLEIKNKIQHDLLILRYKAFALEVWQSGPYSLGKKLFAAIFEQILVTPEFAALHPTVKGFRPHVLEYFLNAFAIIFILMQIYLSERIAVSPLPITFLQNAISLGVKNSLADASQATTKVFFAMCYGFLVGAFTGFTRSNIAFAFSGYLFALLMEKIIFSDFGLQKKLVGSARGELTKAVAQQVVFFFSMYVSNQALKRVSQMLEPIPDNALSNDQYCDTHPAECCAEAERVLTHYKVSNRRETFFYHPDKGGNEHIYREINAAQQQSERLNCADKSGSIFSNIRNFFG